MSIVKVKEQEHSCAILIIYSYVVCTQYHLKGLVRSIILYMAIFKKAFSEIVYLYYLVHEQMTDIITCQEL